MAAVTTAKVPGNGVCLLLSAANQTSGVFFMRRKLFFFLLLAASLCSSQTVLNPQPAPQPTSTRNVTVVFQGSKTQVVPLEESDWTGTYPIFHLNKTIVHESFTATENGSYRASLSIVPRITAEGSSGPFTQIFNCIHVLEPANPADGGGFVYMDEPVWQTFTDSPAFQGDIQFWVKNPYVVSSGPPASGIGPLFSYSITSGTKNLDSPLFGLSSVTTPPMRLKIGEFVVITILLFNPTGAKCMPNFVDTDWQYNYTFTVEKL